ncbi:transposase [Dyadobacter sp. UC 10]|nr:transposase [Dyadobacter sp. UC 10]
METHYIQFFTATILRWKDILASDKYKDIIIESMRFLVNNGRVKIHGFVIMPNHIHLIWRINKNLLLQNVQRDFLKYTAQQIKFDLVDSKSPLLSGFEVRSKDRQYQFWQRNPLSIDLYSPEILEQKLNYIHRNPIQKGWTLAADESRYFYSSYQFYHQGPNPFEFLSHYMD